MNSLFNTSNHTPYPRPGYLLVDMKQPNKFIQMAQQCIKEMSSTIHHDFSHKAAASQRDFMKLEWNFQLEHFLFVLGD